MCDTTPYDHMQSNVLYKKSAIQSYFYVPSNLHIIEKKNILPWSEQTNRPYNIVPNSNYVLFQRIIYEYVQSQKNFTLNISNITRINKIIIFKYHKSCLQDII